MAWDDSFMSPSDSFWLKLWELLAALGFTLVIAGVVIEGVEHFVKFNEVETRRKKRIEKIGWLVLVGGLSLEFWAEHKAKRISDRENARLGMVAAESNRRSKELEATNLTLRSNIVVLERQINAARPESQPITDVSADLFLRVYGMAHEERVKLLASTNELLELYVKVSNSVFTPWKIFRLSCNHELVEEPTVQRVILSAHLTENPVDRWEVKGRTKVSGGGISIDALKTSPVSTIYDIVAMSLRVEALTEVVDTSVVANGTLTIKFNGTTRQFPVSFPKGANEELIIPATTNKIIDFWN
jgi:hypothetical protein